MELAGNGKEDTLIASQMQQMKYTINRMSGIIDSLDFYTRDSKMDDKQENSLADIVRKTINLCEHKLQMANCALYVDLPEMDIKFRCLPVAISQALLNLINNSFDAVEKLEEKWIKIHCKVNQGSFDLMVSDSGHKIPENVLMRIMTPFFTTKAPGKGTGLGLTIVKKILEHHEGALKFDGDKEHTCFTMSLPL